MSEKPPRCARLLGATLAGLVGTACLTPAAGSDAASLSSAKVAVAVVGSPFPADYSPVGLDGQPVDFSQLSGKPVLVNLWATWCPPCMAELPVLVDIDASRRGSGLSLVSVAIDDQTARVGVVAKAQHLSWTLAQDSSGRASGVFDTTDLPTTLLYDRSGQLVYKHIGPLSPGDAALEAALVLTLDQVAGS